MVHVFDEALLGIFYICQQVKMELFSHFPQFMKNLTRAWDMVGPLQGRKKTVGHKRNTSGFCEMTRRGFIDTFPLFLMKFKNPYMKGSSKIPKISVAIEVVEVLL